MAENDGDSRDKNWQRTLARRERDLAEIQNEIAGRGHSRIRRFLPEDHESNPDAQEKKKRQESAYRSALRALLKNDAAYRALYEETFDKLRSYEAATERALERAHEDLAEAKDALDEMRENASTLPDGTRVYRSEDGSVYTEDGTFITGEALDAIEWCNGAPGYEEVLARKQAVATAEERVNGLLIYQTDVLGRVRGRMGDEDNPPSREELDTIQDDLETSAPAAVNHELHASTAPSGVAPKGSDALTPPNLGS